MISKVTKVGRKWVVETDVTGVHQSSPPHNTKTSATRWLESKVTDAKFGDQSERLFSAAIIKGLVEHDDGTRFFGSTMAYTFHVENAVKRGYLSNSQSVSALGREWYEQCLKQLPQTRQVFWTDGVGLPS
jgi:hypothetical protein